MAPTTDWEQPADRHSELVDPVITVRQLSRFEFARKNLTRIDHALVFSTPKGSYDTYLPPVRPTRAEAAAKRYTSVYEVDMGVHPVSAELQLPSDNDAFQFGVVVDLSWQVAEPGRFVACGHRNVPRLVLGELEQAARPVARRFPIADSAAAEAEILRAVAAVGPLGACAGLTVTWTIRLRRDQENIDHQLRLQAINHNVTEQILAQQRGMEYDVELDRRQRQQDALTVGRAMDYGRQQQELTLQQQQWQHEQAMLQARRQVELQQIEAQKIAFYQHHLEQGGVHTWALHLAQHPEDSALVMNSMREDQLRLIQAQMDLVGQLLGANGAENYELEGPKQLALRAVSDILNQRLPGVAQGGPAAGASVPAYPGQLPGQPGAGPGQAGVGVGQTGVGAGQADAGPGQADAGVGVGQPSAGAGQPGAGQPGAGAGAGAGQPGAGQPGAGQPGAGAGPVQPAPGPSVPDPAAQTSGFPVQNVGTGPPADAPPGAFGAERPPAAAPGVAPDAQAAASPVSAGQFPPQALSPGQQPQPAAPGSPYPPQPPATGGGFAGWQPPAGYGNVPVMPQPAAPAPSDGMAGPAAEAVHGRAPVSDGPPPTAGDTDPQHGGTQ
ncbi:hypothetical protein [Streptomyces sp. N35]|uniref:hypothetical protein n=1 Tax=Streptomyces sp. N35 TaxID=2795730 RepID=UPI0018F7455F|nr:hypothetical protein [Streptomyces sp. N35]